ncbi:MAG: hypothetical protein FJ387_00010 [Verrucomicrobia bacterium]|nr:hypothetical protein [Verrucomicrobiota bacterium]
MEFLKKHYEKVILGVVLVGLAVAAALLPLKVASVRSSLSQAGEMIFTRAPKPLPPLDLTTNETLLTRLKDTPELGIDAPGHNLFNPIQWKKRPDGTLYPVPDAGLSSMIVTNIVPLYTRVEFEGGQMTGSSLRYLFAITQEAHTNRTYQRTMRRAVAPGDKTDVFSIKQIKGPRENPEAVVIELADRKTVATITKAKPYQEVDGYAADLRYEPDGRNYFRQRTGQKLTVAGGTYNIVAISESDVTLEDSQTKKRTVIRRPSAM